MVLLMIGYFRIIFQHSEFGTLDIVKLPPLNRPDEDQPGAGAKKDGKDNKDNDGIRHSRSLFVQVKR